MEQLEFDLLTDEQKAATRHTVAGFRKDDGGKCKFDLFPEGFKLPDPHTYRRDLELVLAAYSSVTRSITGTGKHHDASRDMTEHAIEFLTEYVGGPTIARDLIELAMHNGKAKYGRDNWRLCSVEEAPCYLHAARRHIIPMLGRVYADPDSGLPHVAHALCDLMFYLVITREAT